jgi:hypothetical protein
MEMTDEQAGQAFEQVIKESITLSVPKLYNVCKLPEWFK